MFRVWFRVSEDTMSGGIELHELVALRNCLYSKWNQPINAEKPEKLCRPQLGQIHVLVEFARQL